MDDFRQLANIFKKSFHDYKLSIRRIKMSSKTSGDCQCKNKLKKEFVVCINNKAELQEQIQTLIHEVAHMIAWDDPDDHGQKWGKAYSKVYNIYLNDFVNGPE